jgi:hypothetical protein
MDSAIVEELATRLPKSELAQIIKGVLERGKRNIPVSEADLIRAITFGASAVFGKAPPPPPRVVPIPQSTRQAIRREGLPAVPQLDTPARPLRAGGSGGG